MWETLQVLGTLNLFCSPTETALSSQQIPPFAVLAAALLPPRVLLSLSCVTGNLQAVTGDRRISPGFLWLCIIFAGHSAPLIIQHMDLRAILSTRG